MAEKRIYRVSEKQGESLVSETLVRAASQAQAVAHIVKPRFLADVATTDDVARMVEGGAKVQEAGAE